MILRAKSPQFPQLVSVWEASVRATHHFLSEQDIVFFRSQLSQHYLPMVDLYYLGDDSSIKGFLGVSQDNIEMLFIHPDFRGEGIGKILLDYAVNQLAIVKVDVNEQNQQAVGFYLHQGFKIVGRSDTDSMGKPFPLLHLIYQ